MKILGLNVHWRDRKPKHSSSVKRMGRAYAAAAFNRTVADWIAAATSADAEMRGNLKLLRARSRQLGRDNDYVRGAKGGFQDNIVGQGIGFKAQIKKQRGKKLDEDLNAEVETKWADWCEAENCDVEGKLDFWEIERALIGATFEDGECFVRMITQRFGPSKIPLALEIFEADMLDDELNVRLEGGNEIRMGVEYNVWRRPTAYWFLEANPGDTSFPTSVTARAKKHRRIPADEILHIMLPDRLKQTRAVPWTVSAMIRLRHMGGFEESEIIAARAGASLMGFITTPEGELKGDAKEDGDNVTEFEPGVFKKLNPGEDVTVPDNHRPDGSFGPFMQAMLRGVAAGIGVSYETLSKDFTNTSYSSARTSLLSERDRYKVLQKWIIGRFHRRVMRKWLDMADLSGELKLPNYALNPAVYRQAIKWLPRGWAWVDPTKEVEAYKEAVRGGFTTVTKVVAQEGEDFDELVTQRAREVEVTDALGLKFDTDPKNEKGPEKPAPGKGFAKPPKPAGDEDEE